MVVDSSALIAILEGEPEGPTFFDLINSTPRLLISAATMVEASNVALGRRGEAGVAALKRLVENASFEIVPLGSEHIDVAVDGFRRFGKGRHRARLNLGDCFTYALAKATGEPLLFKGDDFSRTDIRAAAERS